MAERDELLHLKGPGRNTLHARVGEFIEAEIRQMNGGDTEKKLCAGCFLQVLFNAARYMLFKNGDELRGWAGTMMNEWRHQVRTVDVIGEPPQEIRDEFVRTSLDGTIEYYTDEQEAA